MVPFCTGCGAEIVEGTRFCVKCGRPLGQPPSPPSFIGQATAMVPPPPAVPAAPVPAAMVQPPAPPAMQPTKQGSGAGVWIALLGILLLLGGAGLWLFSKSRQAAPVVQVVAAPPVAAPSTPATPEVIPPNPDYAQHPELIPPNPDFAQKDQAPGAPKAAAQPKPQPVQTKPAAAPATAAPRPVKAAKPTTGVLHASVEVAQNGEVVFENLPGGRLHFTYDHEAWKATISHQENGTQTLVMRSLKPGLQRSCDVKWEIVE
ncbi:MAG: zinc ribbon domain-containing protein [Bryobacteraceae bacterium]